ncbi:hypothetical protein ES711_08230 [Gelidibacter salicanalis]|uniref:Uncharacterized protein n=1 Tax=Gelidibacter salicanalis TaxID=291193 RepID=A0A5C7ALK5_9FLAO|nr:hypothetical protein [Gelidibacter salicanalis]TXE08483.1 hypothetical protein ES711_08230 [Gelidibacter salicanalis]
MKLLYMFSTLIVMSLTASKCSDAKKMDKKAPAILGDVYVESYTSEDNSGHTGYKLYIPMHSQETKDILLDSVYFRNQTVKLDRTTEGSNTLYTGEFRTHQKSNNDIIMSSNPMDEMANTPPNISKRIPFELEASEGIVSYKYKGDIRYFKIENIQDRTIDN